MGLVSFPISFVTCGLWYWKIDMPIEPNKVLDFSQIRFTERDAELSVMLAEGLPYLNMDEAREIQRALAVSTYSHSNGLHKDDWYEHVKAGVDVCLILGKLEMGTDALLASIISGVFRPKAKPHGFGGPTITLADIKEAFGMRVAKLVENFEHVVRLEERAKNTLSLRTAKEAGGAVADSKEQVDKVIKLILSEAGDWQVLTLHLATHMQALKAAISRGGVGPKARQLAREVLSIEAPLAHRLGVHQLSSGLENLAFKALYPKEFKEVQQATEEKMEMYQEVLQSTMKTVLTALNDDVGFMSQLDGDVRIQHRIKEPYSMWKKMEKQKSGVESVHDAVALRVVLKATRWAGESEESYTARSEALCYQAMAIARRVHPSVQGRFKDYIEHPKPNGYQSLHSTHVAEAISKGEPIHFEFQVRTAEMHHKAEYGHASHWSYKSEETNSLSWMEDNRVEYGRPKAMGVPGQGPGRLAVPKSVSSGRDLVTWLHLELQQRKVFVFGPGNLILELDKRSATAADVLGGFVGRSESVESAASGVTRASVNGKKVPLHYALKNGDVLDLHVAS
ncbi:unnamed protein product [Choristocarpus tenellus]